MKDDLLAPEDWAAGPAIPALGGDALDAPNAMTEKVNRARALAAAEALVVAAPEALTLIEAMLADLKTRAVAPPGAVPAVFDLAAIGDAGVTLLDQILGAGEVSGHVRDQDGTTVAVQESVLTGVWRLHRRAADGTTLKRWVEIGAVPGVAACARTGRIAASLCLDDAPIGTLAARPILVEIIDRAAAYRPGQPNHVVTLSLLPVTQADLAYLKETLGPGPASLHSRGYGSCDIDATGVDGVWSVRFLNASGTVILDTLEVGGVPAAAMAAPEDFADAAVRLAEIRDAYL